ATLERALRIEPAAPAIWLELARLELAQGRYARAEQLARKAESLAVPGSTMAGECHTTVAEARRMAQGGGYASAPSWRASERTKAAWRGSAWNASERMR